MEDRRPAESGEGRAPRKPYQRPRIVFREPIEVMTAICDPSPAGKADIIACPSTAQIQS